MTQEELELELAAFGRSKAQKNLARNESEGRAATNPYAQALYRRFIDPLAKLVQEDIETKKPGRNKAHVTLLQGLDAEAVAFLAVRGTLNSLMANPIISHGDDNKIIDMGASSRAVATEVGRAVYHELLLSLFEEINPDLFHTLTNSLDRRLSKSEEHRMTVFKMQAKKNGIKFPEWGSGGMQQVGAYLVNQLETLGMLETHTTTHKSTRTTQYKTEIHIRIMPEVMDLMDQIKEHVIEASGYYLPAIEPPKPWTAINEGGWHTKAMRRLQPYAIKSHGGWSELAEHDLSNVLGAINTLQEVPWQINSEIIDVVRGVTDNFEMDEVPSKKDLPMPEKPDWLFGEVKVQELDEARRTQYKAWAREKSEWYTKMKLRGTRWGRLHTALTVSEKFKNFESIYFVYFADFRGRLYAQTSGVSPQGSDLQKALIRFRQGKPLTSEVALKWFKINGANKFGYDKDTLDNRASWVDDRHDLILAFAKAPLDNRGWTEADKPFQFLAWCLEYARWVSSPNEFLSHLPIGMDGSCNGLQNFSAMLRDEIGGKATNLVPSALPNDIYQMVADVTAKRLKAALPNAENDYALRWLQHGMNRKLVKRTVMTLPYGLTRFASADYIVADYLKEGLAPEFDKPEYGKAAQYLSFKVWDSIGEVVVKAKEAMTWLQAGARKIIKDGHKDIRWVAPSGFPVIQWYQQVEKHRINTRLAGAAVLKTYTQTHEPSLFEHKNGIAPNFIHSHDAAHLTLVTVEAAKFGLHLAMIHDDYGTHAADAAQLYDIIRYVFVRMYENSDPLGDFARTYGLGQPPAKGSLDLKLVTQSPYFFS